MSLVKVSILLVDQSILQTLPIAFQQYVHAYFGQKSLSGNKYFYAVYAPNAHIDPHTLSEPNEHSAIAPINDDIDNIYTKGLPTGTKLSTWIARMTQEDRYGFYLLQHHWWQVVLPKQ